MHRHTVAGTSGGKTRNRPAGDSQQLILPDLPIPTTNSHGMDYHFPPLGKTCAATGQPLVPGSMCRSALVEQNGSQVRKDFSPQGWNGPPEGAIGHWITRVPERTGPPKLDPEQLMRYFEQLTEEASPSHDETRYLLALMLLQQRRLKLDMIHSDEDGNTLVLIGTRGEGTFQVPHLQLADQEISERQNVLRFQLAAEWNG